MIIDDKLPLKIYEKKRKNGRIKRGNTFDPNEVDEFWALLLEKVCNLDSYDNYDIIFGLIYRWTNFKDLKLNLFTKGIRRKVSDIFKFSFFLLRSVMNYENSLTQALLQVWDRKIKIKTIIFE